MLILDAANAPSAMAACPDDQSNKARKVRSSRRNLQLATRRSSASWLMLLLCCFRFISVTRNNRGPNDLRISCAILMGACKFIDYFRKHSIDVVASR